MAWALYGLVTFNNVMTAVLYDLLEAPPVGLGLTTTQFYVSLTATSVAPIFLSLFGGMLSDRFGVRRIVILGSLLALVGTLLRLVSFGFVDFFIYNILLGVGIGVIFPNLPKMVGLWFPPKQIAIATSLYMTALGLFSGLALALGALFPTWQSAMLTMGLVYAASIVLWLIFAKDRPKGYSIGGQEVVGVPFKEGLRTALTSKSIWLIALSYCLVQGVVQAWVNGMPLVLKEDAMVSAGAAGIVISLSVVGYVTGTVLWVIVSEKWGYLKPVYSLCMFFSGVTGLLTYIFAPGIGMWVLGFFPGLFMGAGHPLVMQMPLHLREIGARYAGSAAGLIHTIGHTMSFLMLPFMFTPIWNATGSGFWAVFLLFAALALAGVLFIGGPEVGRKRREQWAREAAEKRKTIPPEAAAA